MVGILNIPTVEVQAYWVARTDGTVDSFVNGAATPGTPIPGLAAPITGIAGKSDGQGLWLVAVDGGVFASGTSGFYGSLGGVSLSGQIVDLVPTPSGSGYWLIGADGGVFAFGDAAYLGSIPGIGVNVKDVVDATSYANGYCLLEADGHLGCWSTLATAYMRPWVFDRWSNPATTIAVNYGASCSGWPSCSGWVVTRLGHVYPYSGAPNLGQLAQVPWGPIMDASGLTTGYRFVGADGGIFSYNLPWHGNATVTATASGTSTGQPYAKQIARVMLPQGDWGSPGQWQGAVYSGAYGSELRGLEALWRHESSWNWWICFGGGSYPNCNYSGAAYGIPQANPGSKMALAGTPPLPSPGAWQTNTWSQIIWGFYYIGTQSTHFTDPDSAWIWWADHGWY